MKSCLHCGKEVRTRYNKYCDSKCSGEHRKAKRKQQWLDGSATNFDMSTLKTYLTEDRGYACSCCGISDYNGKPLSLQVDHIDGNGFNHSPDNLRLLCPNCHSQQDNWGYRNVGYGRGARLKNMSLSSNG